MKIAEAMKEKSRLKKKVSELRTKLEQAAQGKGARDERPKDQLLELEDTLRHMGYLTAAIYHANDRIMIDGKTLTRLIYTRDTQFFRLDLYRNLIRLISETGDQNNPESLSISALEAKAERIKEEIRSLNELIERANWTEELAEN